MSTTFVAVSQVIPRMNLRSGTVGISDEEAYVKAAFDLSHDIANLLECAAHFFRIRFVIPLLLVLLLLW